MKRVMVGISGTPGSQQALDWAVGYAESVSAELELVHVVDLGWRPVAEDLAEALLLEAERKLRALAASRDEARVTIHCTVLVGSPLYALVEHAADARLLVIGTDVAGPLRGRVLNTLATRIASRTAVSVVVVPHRDAASFGAGIVAGVDGSENSTAALAFAAREADRLGEPLHAVHSWYVPEPWADSFVPMWPGEPDETERLILAEELAGLAQAYPDLRVESEVIFGRAANVLHEAALAARMLVVGSHGRRGVERILLGSTSEDLLHSMPTIVAVIR